MARPASSLTSLSKVGPAKVPPHRSNVIYYYVVEGTLRRHKSQGCVFQRSDLFGCRRHSDILESALGIDDETFLEFPIVQRFLKKLDKGHGLSPDRELNLSG